MKGRVLPVFAVFLLFGFFALSAFAEDIPASEPSHVCDHILIRFNEEGHWEECSVCGSLTESQPHEYAWITDREPTCTETGIKHRLCVCGYETDHDTATGPLGHCWSDKGRTTDRKATTAADGESSLHCVREGCAARTEIRSIPKVSDISLNYNTFACDLMQRTPTPVVKDSTGKLLDPSSDYTVAYPDGDRSGIGEYPVTVALSGDCYEGSIELLFKILPANVTGLKATQTANSITLSWDETTAAEGYRIFTYDSTSKKYTRVAQTAALTYTFTGLKAGSAHTYYVKAFGKSGGKTYVSKAYTRIDTSVRPANVKGFSAAQTVSSVKLTWNKVTGATGYRVYVRNPSVKIYDVIADTTDTGLTVSGLKAGTAYTYYIKAYKNVGGKPLLSPAYKNVKTATRPKKVTGITSEPAATSAMLSWERVNGASEYRIYRYSSVTGKYTVMYSVRELRCRVKGLKPGNDYTFYLKAVLRIGNKELLSGSYAPVNVSTAPKPPVSPKLVPGQGKLSVHWTECAGADGYELSVRKPGSSVYVCAAVTKNQSYTVKLLSSGKTAVRVRAFRTVNGKRIFSDWSSSVSALVR